MPWAGRTQDVPLGWLTCDGSLKRKEEYPNLYERIKNSSTGLGNYGAFTGDSSINNNNLNVTGSPIWDDTSYKFGRRSFNVTSSDTLYIPSTYIDLGNDFTFECFFKFNTAPVNGQSLLGCGYTSSSNGFDIYIDNVSSGIAQYNFRFKDTVQSHVFGSVSTGTWNHIAVTSYNDGTQYNAIFYNGEKLVVSDNTYTFSGPSKDLYFGKDPDANNPLADVSFDEVRISNIARYSALDNFTPPTSPYEVDEHTMYLYHFEPNMFYLPDLRGRFIRGVDKGRAKDIDSASRVQQNQYGNTGDNVGSIQNDDYKSHYHNFKYTHDNHGSGNEGMNRWRFTNSCCLTSTASQNPVGGVETRPENVAINYIIKT